MSSGEFVFAVGTGRVRQGPAGFRRIRLTLQDAASVSTNRRPSSWRNHTGARGQTTTRWLRAWPSARSSRVILTTASGSERRLPVASGGSRNLGSACGQGCGALLAEFIWCRVWFAGPR